MAENPNKVPASKINPHVLWQLDGEQFNAWRREHDYPRIIAFFKTRLQDFSAWMEDQEISDDLLIQHCPSAFLKNQDCLYLYGIIDGDQKAKQILSEAKYVVGSTFFHQNHVQQRKDILPYPAWFLQKNKKRAPDIYVNSKQDRSHYIMNELELLDLGNCYLNGMFILSSRLLDFVNISDLRLTNCLNNSSLQVFFSSATNLTVEGDLHFINAYKTSFYEVFNQKFQNLKLLNGSFQNWSFTDCEVNLSATNAVLNAWDFTGCDFTATISNTDIRNCKFSGATVRYPIDYGRNKELHAHIKRLYSQIGKKKEASQHYYLEKTYERKSFWHSKPNYQMQYVQEKTQTAKRILRFRFLLKWVMSVFLNHLWGYGERPARVFVISIFTLLFFAFAYCYLPHASADTHYDFANSLYYSMVTFTTLGYGDISQPDRWLRLLSGFEALLGMTFWGILIAGFSSNAKDY